MSVGASHHHEEASRWTISSMVEGALDNEVVVPRALSLLVTWILECAHQHMTSRCGSSKAHLHWVLFMFVEPKFAMNLPSRG